MAFRQSRRTRSSTVEPLLFIQMMNKYFSGRSGEGGSDLRFRARLTAFTNDITSVSLSSPNATGQPQVVASLILQFTIKRVDSLVRFEVSDTGCGFPAQFLARISEPFVTHGKSNGTEPALAISKAVVEADRGSISVKSSDRGKMFQVDLPLEP
jgi:signal transduction histidine kinase